MTNNLTYLGFDTSADAKTFKKFLDREGYESIMLSKYDEKTKLFKVFFRPKDNM